MFEFELVFLILMSFKITLLTEGLGTPITFEWFLFAVCQSMYFHISLGFKHLHASLTFETFLLELATLSAVRFFHVNIYEVFAYVTVIFRFVIVLSLMVLKCHLTEEYLATQITHQTWQLGVTSSQMIFKMKELFGLANHNTIAADVVEYSITVIVGARQNEILSIDRLNVDF